MDDRDPFETIGPDKPADATGAPEGEPAVPEEAEKSGSPTPPPAPEAGGASSDGGDPAFESIGEPSEAARDSETAGASGDGDGGRRPVRLIELSRRAYEHPADRAALAALRNIPALDVVLRKVIGFIGERSLRLLFLASAVRVDERQFTRVFRIYMQCCKTLDVPRPPELYVAQTPLVNAGALGVDEPFIVVNSATIELLNDEELAIVLGHELGHVLSGHALYKTMFALLLEISRRGIGIPIGSIALFAIVAALREWDRKSELSCDRAGLLAAQNVDAAYTVHMKLAGGGSIKQMSLDAFVAQADEYARAGTAVDGIFKLLNVIGRSHPFHVTRLRELKRWVDEGHYDAVLRGDYPRRGVDELQPLHVELLRGASAYRDDYERSEEPLVRFFNDLGASVSQGASDALTYIKGLFGNRSDKP